MYFVNTDKYDVLAFKKLTDAREYLKDKKGFITKLEKDNTTLTFKESNMCIREVTAGLIEHVKGLFNCDTDAAAMFFYDLKDVPFEIKNGLFFVKDKKHITSTIFSAKGTADGYVDKKGNYYSCSGKKYPFK